MNERIRELLEQAAKTTQGDSWEEQTKFMERFAELIVKECGQIAYSEENDYGNKIRFMILEHFGVEE